jgi:hypothetical protein
LSEQLRYAIATENYWLAYFERTLPKLRSADPTAAYERLMKYGLSRHYWNEYIFLAYAHYRQDCVYLAGIPDLPRSLPHSKAGAARWGD